MSYTKYLNTDVEINLDEWEEKEIIEYMEDLGYVLTKTPEDSFMLEKLADAKVYHPENFDKLFSEYIYKTIGRIV
jgi:hypothetical protein